MQSLSYPKILGITVTLGVTTWLLFGFFGIQALFMDRVVNEAIPEVALVEQSSSPTTTTMVVNTTSSTTSTETPAIRPISPPPPQPPLASSPKLLAQGSFTQGDSTYSIQGKAMITEKDGVRTLSFSNFNVTNGPDLFVYITEAGNAENLTVKNAIQEKRFINLGTLKGNKGNQTYALPKDLILNKNSLVTIWCRRFSRHFGSADLTLTP